MLGRTRAIERQEKTCGFEVGGGYHGVVIVLGSDPKDEVDLQRSQLIEGGVNPEAGKGVRIS